MLRIHKSICCITSLQSIKKRFCSSVGKVKVISRDEEDLMRISFRYGKNTQNVLNMKLSKQQQISDALAHIQLVINLQRKKEEIRQSVRYLSGETIDESYQQEVEVSFVPSHGSFKGDVSNKEAWARGSVLKIGDDVYEVNHNTPTVIQLVLPEYILVDSYIRPHYIFECASVEDCSFTWYRLENSENDSEEVWVKVGEELLYRTSSDDVGHKLKVVCTPKMGDAVGPDFSCVASNLVELGPQTFPFQERQLHTKEFVGTDCIRCLSYNVLANCYVESKKFPYCSKKGRNNYYRRQVVIKEILGYNADVLCMQEVQERMFHQDLVPVLQKYGLGGFFVRKGGRRYEGLAVFYRTAKFRLVEQEGVHLNEIVKDKEIFTDLLQKVSGNYKDMSKLLAQDTALQIVYLEHIDNPKHKLIIANTHLYSNKDKPEVRLIQAALCTQYIDHFFKMKNESCSKSKAVVFCGDFNSLPNSAAHEFMMNGSFQCSSSWKNNSSEEEIDTTLRHNLALESACGTPTYTNYTEEFFGCLDYIFYSANNLSVNEVVPMVRHEDVTHQVALPSEYFPSDHLPLICTLKWNQWL